MSNLTIVGATVSSECDFVLGANGLRQCLVCGWVYRGQATGRLRRICPAKESPNATTVKLQQRRMAMALFLPQQDTNTQLCRFSAIGQDQHQCSRCKVIVESSFASNQIRRICQPRGLGDFIASCLTRLGITAQRWSAARGPYRILGGHGTACLVYVGEQPCGCPERIAALNKFGWWVADRWKATVAPTVALAKLRFSRFRRKPPVA